MFYCSKCGTAYNDGDVPAFCKSCGNQLNASTGPVGTPVVSAPERKGDNDTSNKVMSIISMALGIFCASGVMFSFVLAILCGEEPAMFFLTLLMAVIFAGSGVAATILMNKVYQAGGEQNVFLKVANLTGKIGIFANAGVLALASLIAFISLIANL